VHRPRGVQPREIYIGNNHIKKRIYSFPAYQYRLLTSFFSLKNNTNFYAAYKFNNALKKGWKNSHYFEDYPTDINTIDKK
jgi:hypothetical protein